MKYLIILFLSFSPLIVLSQENFKSEYQLAEKLLKNSEFESAYSKFKSLEQKIPKSDSLYDYVLYYYVVSTSQLEESNRKSEKFKESLKYGLEAIQAIEKGKHRFNSDFAKREYYMTKNIVVSYFGNGDFELGKKWKDKMYVAQKNNELPKGIDKYFNFDFFTIGDKNVWGYEWFAELPENRYSSSFTKIVYYVYSTNPDGSDKDQLYRLHVLMFHGDGVKFDYVLDKRSESKGARKSGTMYAYTYQEDINYKKLQNDIKEIVKEDIKTDTKRVTTKGKNGKINVDVELDPEK